MKPLLKEVNCDGTSHDSAHVRREVSYSGNESDSIKKPVCGS